MTPKRLRFIGDLYLSKPNSLQKFLKLVVVGVIPECLIALIAMLVNNDGQAFWLALLVIFAVYALIWLKNSVYEWIIFLISGKKDIRENAFKFLKDNNFPEPDDYTDSAQDYFESIANNEENSPDLRVKAALQLGVIGSIAQIGKFQRAIRVNMAMNDGLKTFKKSFKLTALAGVEPFQI